MHSVDLSPLKNLDKDLNIHRFNLDPPDKPTKQPPSDEPSGDRENEFKVKYGSEQNDIDANTLIHSLMSVTTIIQEVNNDIGTGAPLN